VFFDPFGLIYRFFRVRDYRGRQSSQGEADGAPKAARHSSLFGGAPSSPVGRGLGFEGALESNSPDLMWACGRVSGSRAKSNHQQKWPSVLSEKRNRAFRATGSFCASL
jgi:hypothetical protein